MLEAGLEGEMDGHLGYANHTSRVVTVVREPVERGVGLTVRASIEPVAARGLAGPGRDRADAAEFRERYFGSDPVTVVSSVPSISAAESNPIPNRANIFGAAAWVTVLRWAV